MEIWKRVESNECIVNGSLGMQTQYCQYRLPCGICGITGKNCMNYIQQIEITFLEGGKENGCL